MEEKNKQDIKKEKEDAHETRLLKHFKHAAY